MIDFIRNHKVMTNFYFFLDNHVEVLYSNNYENDIRILVEEYINTRLNNILNRVFPDYLVNNMLSRNNEPKLVKLAYEYFDRQHAIINRAT